MVDERFISPTKIYFGKDEVRNIRSILLDHGFHDILIVIGQSSVRKSGLLDRVLKYLGPDIVTYILEGVRPNPRVELVREGVRLAREKKVAAVLAIGGGSVIDTAKAIAAGFYHEGDPYDLNLYRAKVKKALPVGVILTLAASGSELSSSCVIADDEHVRKQGFNSDLIRPVFAVMDPLLTVSVDRYQTACGIVDIISHSLERYFSPSGRFEFSDNLALAIIRNMIEVGKTCLSEPHDVDARAQMMLTGSFSHNGVTGLGKRVVFIIHRLEHALSAHDVRIAHGAGLAVLIPAWMSHVRKDDPKKFARFAREIFKIEENDDDRAGEAGIKALRDYFKEIGMPVTLRELDLPKEDIGILADRLTLKGTIIIGEHSIHPLSREDVMSIFLSVY